MIVSGQKPSQIFSSLSIARAYTKIEDEKKIIMEKQLSWKSNVDKNELAKEHRDGVYNIVV